MFAPSWHAVHCSGCVSPCVSITAVSPFSSAEPKQQGIYICMCVFNECSPKHPGCQRGEGTQKGWEAGSLLSHSLNCHQMKTLEEHPGLGTSSSHYRDPFPPPPTCINLVPERWVGIPRKREGTSPWVSVLVSAFLSCPKICLGFLLLSPSGN